ncbi:MAG: HepT-like ribonuclease domain-containing protein [Variovorax sp.]
MHADAAKLLWDAQEAATRIARYTIGKTLSDYEADDFLRSAVERQFEIVGEALGALRRVDPLTAARIGALSRVVAFRNVLIHGYANVDHRVVWGVVEGQLQALRDELDSLLAQS